MKRLLRKRAINLRREGLSYSEILQKIPVAKSTLSLWLRSVSISKRQTQRITEKRSEAIQRGWQSRKKERIKKTIEIKRNAKLEISRITKKNLFFIGIMLYWAEGAKQKTHDISQGVCFSNSDSLMVKVFLKWLRVCLKITDEDISFDIYIHKNHKDQNKKVKKYWSNVTGFPNSKFDKIYYKRHKLKTNRHNINNHYYGLLRIKVKRSTDLNRKISGWIEGVCVQCRVV